MVIANKKARFPAVWQRCHVEGLEGGYTPVDFQRVISESYRYPELTCTPFLLALVV